MTITKEVLDSLYSLTERLANSRNSSHQNEQASSSGQRSHKRTYDQVEELDPVQVPVVRSAAIVTEIIDILEKMDLENFLVLLITPFCAVPPIQAFDSPEVVSNKIKKSDTLITALARTVDAEAFSLIINLFSKKGVSRTGISFGLSKSKNFLSGANALIVACQAGELSLVQMLSEFITADSIDYSGTTPFLAACASGDLKLVEWLMNSGFKIDTIDYKGRGALYMACEGKNKDVVGTICRSSRFRTYGIKENKKMLMHTKIAANRSGNQQINTHIEPLFRNVDFLSRVSEEEKRIYFYSVGQSCLLKLYDEQGRENAEKYIFSILEGALSVKDSEDKVKFIKEIVKIVLKEKIPHNIVLLFQVLCKSGNVALTKHYFERLVENQQEKQKSQIRDLLSKSMILSCAFLSGNMDCVEYVYKKLPNAELDVVFAMESACKIGNPDLVAKLFGLFSEKVAEFTDQQKCNAIIYALQSGNLDLSNYLFERFPVSNPSLTDGANIIIAVCQNGNLDMVRFYWEHYPTIRNSRKINGATPLMLACQRGHFEVVDFLLQQQEININDTMELQGTTLTAFFLACQNCHLELVGFLLEKGVDIGATSCVGTEAEREVESKQNIRKALIALCANDLSSLHPRFWILLGKDERVQSLLAQGDESEFTGYYDKAKSYLDHWGEFQTRYKDHNYIENATSLDEIIIKLCQKDYDCQVLSEKEVTMLFDVSNTITSDGDFTECKKELIEKTKAAITSRSFVALKASNIQPAQQLSNPSLVHNFVSTHSSQEGLLMG
jgi:ankyrin repeat protein